MPSNIKILIEDIIGKEWNMFTNVRNEGGRASCQDDYETFYIMRASQFEAWDTASLLSYNGDLDDAIKDKRNIVTEKYAYMMEYTANDEWQRIKSSVPEVPERKMRLIKEILDVMLKETAAFFSEYPGFKKNSRPLYRSDDAVFTSIETYTEGELKTYSENTLQAYLKHIKELEGKNDPIVFRIYENTARHYGYDSVDDAHMKL